MKNLHENSYNILIIFLIGVSFALTFSITNFLGFLQPVYYLIEILGFFRQRAKVLEGWDKKRNYPYVYVVIGYAVINLLYSISKKFDQNDNLTSVIVTEFGSFGFFIGEFLEEYCRFSYFTFQKYNFLSILVISLLFSTMHQGVWTLAGRNGIEYYLYAFFSSITLVLIGVKYGWKYSFLYTS